jgi:hypothetical protein
MADQSRFGRARCAALLFVVFVQLVGAAGAQDKPPAPDPAAAQPPVRSIPKERIFVRDIQGTWISKRYLDALRTLRAPHAAARKTPALVIKVEKEERSYPILTTDFQRAVLQFLLDVEPGLKPGSYRMVAAPEDRTISASEVTYIDFRGARNADGKLEELAIAEPKFAKRKYVTFVRLPDPLDVVVDRLVIAGKYHDEQGRAYEFSEAGDAVLPDRQFAYELSLDPRNANCELLQSRRDREPQGNERIGFEWRGARLRLFQVIATGKNRYACQRRPFAVLTPA